MQFYMHKSPLKYHSYQNFFHESIPLPLESEKLVFIHESKNPFLFFSFLNLEKCFPEIDVFYIYLAELDQFMECCKIL